MRKEEGMIFGRSHGAKMMKRMQRKTNRLILKQKIMLEDLEVRRKNSEKSLGR